MDPQQELFTALKLNIEALGYDVYDSGLPPEGTPYPFVYLGDSQQTDRPLKNATVGSVSQKIHVWHSDPKKRGTVSEMLMNIKVVCRKLDKTANYMWAVSSAIQQIIPDNTTTTPLLHGVLDITFNY